MRGRSQSSSGLELQQEKSRFVCRMGLRSSSSMHASSQARGCAAARFLCVLCFLSPAPTSPRRGALAERSSTRACSERSRSLGTPSCLSGSPDSGTTITHIKDQTEKINYQTYVYRFSKLDIKDQTEKINYQTYVYRFSKLGHQT